jgi:hypothetical protein
MEKREGIADFSLFGGPLHRLGCRSGLVRGTNTVLLGLALGVGLWLIVLTLAFIEGVTDHMFTLRLIAGHARLLVVIPLFFICESWVNPRMTAFVRTIAQSGIVPPSALPALNAEVARTNRWKDAWWPEAVCLLAAVVMAVTGSSLQTVGESGVYDPRRAALGALVYFQGGLTLFRFLLFRWVWKLALWSWFLWRVSRLDLHLLPGHPDRDGGLGSLEGVHERFTPLVVAISVLECSALAETNDDGTITWYADETYIDFTGGEDDGGGGAEGEGEGGGEPDDDGDDDGDEGGEGEGEGDDGEGEGEGGGEGEGEGEEEDGETPGGADPESSEQDDEGGVGQPGGDGGGGGRGHVTGGSLGTITRGGGYTDPSPDGDGDDGGAAGTPDVVRPGGGVSDPPKNGETRGFARWGGYNPPIGRERDPYINPGDDYSAAAGAPIRRSVSSQGSVRIEEFSGPTPGGSPADGLVSAGMAQDPDGDERNLD